MSIISAFRDLSIMAANPYMSTIVIPFYLGRRAILQSVELLRAANDYV
jgi:hypothetical protein